MSQMWTTDLHQYIIWIWYFRPLVDVPLYIISDADLRLRMIIEDDDLAREVRRRMLNAGVRTVEVCGLRMVGSDDDWPSVSGSTAAGVKGKTLKDFEALWTRSLKEYVVWVKYWIGSPDVPRYLIVRKSNGAAVQFAWPFLFEAVLLRMLDAGVETLEFCTFEETLRAGWKINPVDPEDSTARMIWDA